MKIKMRAILVALMLLVWLIQLFVKGFLLALFGWLGFVFSIILILVFAGANPNMTLEDFISGDLKNPDI